MGTAVSKAHTELESSRTEGNGLAIGHSGMQGWRQTMEDAFHAEVDIENMPGWTWVAVFDGHGGSEAATASSKRLLRFITKQRDWRGYVTPREVSRCVKAAFLEMDAELKTTAAVKREGSGTTVAAALISPTHIFVINLGDSRVMAVRGGRCKLSTDDHKPITLSEKRRIYRAGGTVTLGRINGNLAVSRSLGDHKFKANAELGPEQQMVSPVPDVDHFGRKTGDEFLVLACDGVWDVLREHQVIKTLHTLHRKGEVDTARLAQHLVKSAFNLGSRDNISAAVVRFPGLGLPSRAVQVAYRESLRVAAVAEAESSSKTATDDLDTTPTRLVSFDADGTL